MSAISRWLRGARALGHAAAPKAAPPPLNPSTWAVAADLIALQPHASGIGLRLAEPARASRAGDHASRFRGRGMDYRESRGYVAGDDVRSMDWRVTARTGSPHVKVYEEARERPVVLLLDLNPCMFFGSRRQLKSVAAAHAASLLAWAAVDGGDRVGAVLSNGDRCEIQPRGGRHGALNVIRQLVRHTDPRAGIDAAAEAGALNAALHRLCRVSRPGSLTVLIGDFSGLDEHSDQLLGRLRRHGDVVAVQIVDPLEQEAPPPALYDIETDGRRGQLDTRAARSRVAYREHFAARRNAVAEVLRRHAIALVRISTTDDIANALRTHFPGGPIRSTMRRLAA